MRSVSEHDAAERLGALIDEVQSGVEVLITRHGKPVARLVPSDAGVDSAKARQAAEGLRAASKGQTLDGMSLKELVNEGRR
jgi:prevent-host-death family protein